MGREIMTTFVLLYFTADFTSWTTQSGLCEPAEGKEPSSRAVQTVLFIRSLGGRLTELS